MQCVPSDHAYDPNMQTHCFLYDV